MVKYMGVDRSCEGTEDKMSDHPCCRINRDRINRVALYTFGHFLNDVIAAYNPSFNRKYSATSDCY